jgi:hypothetical protein
MTDRFEAVLDESISALQAGIPIEEILAEVPDYATELRPLLYAATLLADPKPELAPEETKAALRSHYMEQVLELPPVPPSLGDKIGAISRIFKRRVTREAVISDLITITITVVLTLLMGALLLAYAARSSIPGDFLYGIKILSENIQLSLVFDEQGKADLQDQFNQRRLPEIERLIQQNRAAAVQFQGDLEVKGEGLWIIEGYTIILTEDTAINSMPQEGDMVEVVGYLRTDGSLVADTIRAVDP